MKPQFDVQVMELKSVNDMPDAWSDAIFRQILQQVEYEDIDEIDPVDLREMAVMALQDVKPETAAEIVLANLLSDQLTSGVRQNLAHELKEKRMWEDYANNTCHADLFLTAVLLNQAFPKLYFQPDIARLTLALAGENTAAAKLLAQPPTTTWAARLLGGGMEDNAPFKRMYGDQLAGTQFPEADAIIWQANLRNQQENRAELIVYSSWYWLRPLKNIRTYQTTAWSDQ